MSNFTLKTLTEGIRQRHMGAQHQRLTEKWSRTGLLRGLEGYKRENMAVMLENQAAQVLREANSLGSSATSTSSGDIRGFQNVAFPIVRRVFGGLIANDLVSIQPMSLPSGLLFYLDYTYGTNQGGADIDGTLGAGERDDAGDSATYAKGSSIYNNPAGKGIQSGSLGLGGQYDLLGSGFSRRHLQTAMDTIDNVAITAAIAAPTIIGLTATGVVSAGGSADTAFSLGLNYHTELTGAIGRLCDFDAQLANEISIGAIPGVMFALVPAVTRTAANGGNSMDGTAILVTSVLTEATYGFSPDLTMLQDIAMVKGHGTTDSPDDGSNGYLQLVPANIQAGSNVLNVRRLNKRVDFDAAGRIVVDPMNGTCILMVLIPQAGLPTKIHNATADNVMFSYIADASRASGDSGDSLVVPAFESAFASNEPTGQPTIPEIDIKIESLAVTAVTRKLKAKWSPELAQDLNAYHSLDAEVELTQILSEQIALELDREILNDLLTQANGANLYWSRAPGKFVNKLSGAEVARNSSLRPGPQFTGTVRDWYETLIETVIDAANIIHRKTLRGSANFMVIGPDVATILESSLMYKPAYSIDGDGQVGSPMNIGAEKIGTLSNRFTVYKDPYFPRNKILVGYKGGSYLETGYVYAPYVPLIVTPTIFAPEDFTPRKGVMTRYGKKMVRSDFYGTVTCMDMNII